MYKYYISYYLTKEGEHMITEKEWVKNIEAEYEKYIKLCEQLNKKPMTLLQFILAKIDKRIH